MCGILYNLHIQHKVLHKCPKFGYTDQWINWLSSNWKYSKFVLEKVMKSLAALSFTLLNLPIFCLNWGVDAVVFYQRAMLSKLRKSCKYD